MSAELNIYEGCYALLRNGSIVGPITRSETFAPWVNVSDTGRINFIWYEDGKYTRSIIDNEYDIIKTGSAVDFMYLHQVDPNHLKIAMGHEYGKTDAPVITPDVLKAAMDAGLKVDPTYEAFVRAILTAGMAAASQPSIFLSKPERTGVTVFSKERLRDELSLGLKKDEAKFADRPPAQQEIISRAAERVAAYLISAGAVELVERENESVQMDSPSENIKGGLSGLCEDEGCPHHGTAHVCVSSSLDLADYFEKHGLPLGILTLVKDVRTEVEIKGTVNVPAKDANNAFMRSVIDQGGELAPVHWNDGVAE